MIGAGPLPAALRLADSTAAPSRAPRSSSGGVAALSAVVALVVAGGWLVRDRIPLTPESGPGYALGVAGGTAILLLGAYSARKHLRFLRGWGVLRQWFRIHMLLGVLAPLLILFHCNFRLGAPNSNVALVSLLIVAGSGVVGRYIYTRISHGLYGARASLAELRAQLDTSAQAVGERLSPGSRVRVRLDELAARAHSPSPTLAGRSIGLMSLPLRAARVRRWVREEIHAELASGASAIPLDADERRARGEAARDVADAYVAALVKEAQFGVHERLFSLWHALHVPLFVMLILSGVVHVVAVHMY